MKKLILCLTCLMTLPACDNSTVIPHRQLPAATLPVESRAEQEIMTILEKGNLLGERSRQVNAIRSVFRRRTSPDRARQLAALCYTKTLDTPFMPFDLAEIALVETGGNRLSGRAVSPRGALGVWQIMPHRAKSHGYTPGDMVNDEKCAEAAVRELYTKLEPAGGDLERAKRLYCGQGPQADGYLRKLKRYRNEMTAALARSAPLVSMAEPASRIR